MVREKTKVVNIRGMPEFGKGKGEVYIGDATRSGRKRSIWHNPYHRLIRTHGREKVIEMYREYIKTRPDLLNRLDELKGKTLGCWCRPLPCHGDVLVELIEKGEKGR